MAISKKKKAAVLRGYPKQTPAELARRHALAEAEVLAILREAGVLREDHRQVVSNRVLGGVLAGLLVVGSVAVAVRWWRSQPDPAGLVEQTHELNVLLLSIDTLRADHVGAYGYAQAHTPVIDALAASGLRFDRAYAHQPITLPSHTTILTGTHPAFHGVRDNGLFTVPAELDTLAEVLGRNGFSTGAVVGSRVLHKQFGLNQGFDQYDDSMTGDARKSTGHFEELGARQVADKAVAWLDTHGQDRWFLWVHFYDPHNTYDAPDEFRKLAATAYDGEITYVDHELGRVLDKVAALGQRDHTLVVFVADHGESLGEHGYMSHTLFLYDGIMRVPLVMSLPGILPQGRVSDALVSLSDVAPTVVDLLDLPPLRMAQGQSLSPLLFDGKGTFEERPVLMETHAPWFQHGWSPLLAIRSGDDKYIEAPRPELYDAGVDQAEEHDLIALESGRAAELVALLKETRARWASASPVVSAPTTLDDETVEQLGELGYLLDGSEAGEPGADAPDPKDMIPVIDMTNDALSLRAKGRTDEAIAVLEEALARSPNDRRTLNRLGMWNARQGRLDEAERYLLRLQDLDPNYQDGITNLAAVYMDQGRLEESARLVEHLLTLNPRNTKYHLLQGEVRWKSGDRPGALASYQAAVEVAPRSYQAWTELGRARGQTGDHAGARDAFVKALELDPGNGKVQKLLAEAERNLRAP